MKMEVEEELKLGEPEESEAAESTELAANEGDTDLQKPSEELIQPQAIMTSEEFEIEAARNEELNTALPTIDEKPSLNV